MEKSQRLIKTENNKINQKENKLFQISLETTYEHYRTILVFAENKNEAINKYNEYEKNNGWNPKYFFYESGEVNQVVEIKQEGVIFVSD